MGKGVVDLVFFSDEKMLAVLEIQPALKYESMEFLGIRTIKWVRFPEFGLGHRSMGLDEFIDGLDEFVSFWFILSQGCVWSIVRCFVIYEVSMEGFRLYRLVCGLVCSQHGYRSGKMWQSSSSWARVSGKVEDGVVS